MNPITWLILAVIKLYFYIIIAQIIYSWLVHFNVLNRYQPFVQQLGVFFQRMTEPAYRRIRKYVPPIGGFDLSPIILILALQFVAYTVAWAS